MLGVHVAVQKLADIGHVRSPDRRSSTRDMCWKVLIPSNPNYWYNFGGFNFGGFLYVSV